ncbi:MAG TPA: sulfatase [Thermoanaerobaculia bacterium]|nr:sulfatase [Thermoanaerobaculia bacterium]
MRGKRSLAALLILFTGAAKPPVASPPRRILLITVDTLRADALSCYRAQTPGTPALDALAGDSVVFRQARSAAPWTLPALASAMTGVSPQVHLATELGGRVPDRLTTIAEVLRRAGYRTAALVSSPLLGRAAHLDQGFQEYTAFPGETGMAGTRPADPDRLAGLASRWLRGKDKDRFFLWVHFYDPHTPYEPPAAYLQGLEPPPGMRRDLTVEEHLAIRLRQRDPAPAEREWVRQLYRAEVRWVDAAVGTLIAELKRSGHYEDTLIVLLSDHGDEFWEHGRVGHGHTLYEELLRVPFLVKLPGDPGGHRRGEIGTPVSTASLAATILDLAGKPLPPSFPAAPSLAPWLRGETEAILPGPEPLLSTGVQRLEEQEAILFGGFKLIRWETSGRQELYDVDHDPEETADLAASAPRKVKEGGLLLDRRDAESNRARKELGLHRERVTLDPEAMKRLRALGYGG